MALLQKIGKTKNKNIQQAQREIRKVCWLVPMLSLVSVSHGMTRSLVHVQGDRRIFSLSLIFVFIIITKLYLQF